MTQIVTVNVSQTQAPTPSTLQQTGGAISVGSTTAAAGTRNLITQVSDMTALLKNATAVGSATWASGVVTLVTTGGYFTDPGTYQITVSGMVPAAYNGTFQATVASSGGAMTYALATNPGTATTMGSASLEGVDPLLAIAETFFAQGSAVAYYAIELGSAGSHAADIALLTTYLQQHPNEFYHLIVPREWAGEATYQALVAQYQSPTSQLYFHTTVTLSNYTQYTALQKAVIAYLEAPGIPASEFSAAMGFYKALSYNPSATNMVTPFAFSFGYNVTPYPTEGNSALLATLKAAFINVIGTGIEGGIPTAMLLWGTTMDGRDFTYWFATDWVDINVHLALANAIINGSNNPLAPLYFNQPGIDTLKAVVKQTMAAGITFGLLLSPVTVTATSFLAYTTANPGDYKIGKFNGLGAVATPQRGFIAVVFNFQVTDFISG